MASRQSPVKSMKSEVGPRSRELTGLFSSPQVVARLLDACYAPSASSLSVRDIVLHDAALCAKIVTAAASCAAAPLDPASPLSSALSQLTLPVIKSLALESARALAQASLTPAEAQVLRELWFCSSAAGAVARCAAEGVSYRAPEEAQITGMMLNIGMLSLFSAHPAAYLSSVSTAISSREVRAREQIAFGTDHIRIAADIVDGWRLDSFMGDAIRFVHAEGERSAGAGLLVKIAQLARERCTKPFPTDGEAVAAAARLLNLREVEASLLLERAGELYAGNNPFDGSQDQYLLELERGTRELSSAVFSLLERESIMLHLAGEVQEEPLESARQLYLHRSTATGAIFFTADGCDGLAAVPSGSRRASELATPLSASNLLAAAVRENRVLHSFDAAEAELAVFDHHLIGLCKGSGIACIPLRLNDRPAGGVVLGLEGADRVDNLDVPEVASLGTALARALSRDRRDPSAGAEGGPAAEGALIPRLAHEIANPLAIINNYVAAIGVLAEGEEIAAILSAVKSQVARIDEIVNYYRHDGAGEKSAADSAVSLDAAAASVVEILTPTHFAPKGIEIVSDFDPSVAAVQTNPLAIRQILVNLMANAAEALGENGRIVLRIREQIASSGTRWVTIGIEDNGPGIEASVLARLFSPVSSTKRGHAGLGLSIVKRMADDIGATISCHSTPASGTAFCLMIPRSN